MRKHLFYVACLIGMSFGLVSCEIFENDAYEITVYGNVIDRTTGQPLYNVLIQEESKIGGSTVTGNDGNYEFTLPLDGNDEGKYLLIASKDKYSSSEYELNIKNVDKNRKVKVDFQLISESIFYKGIVVDNENKPIVDAHISAQYSSSGYEGTDYNIGTTVITDINGGYSLELPRPSAYDQWKFAITASKDGYSDQMHVLNQNVDDMGKTITLNFVLKSNSVTVSGRVVNQNGQPIANAKISDKIFYTGNYGAKILSTTQTDANGNFTINSLVYLQVNSYDSRNHEYLCEKEGYISQRKYLYTADDDGGNSYTIDFILTPSN